MVQLSAGAANSGPGAREETVTADFSFPHLQSSREGLKRASAESMNQSKQIATAMPRVLHTPLTEETNPFVIPDNEALFALADKENRPRKEYLEAQRSLRVAEKETLSCQMQGGCALPPGELNPRRFTQKQPLGGLAQVAAAQPRPRARRAELENMARFIAKKREIFLVQMALNIKSAEMRRLGERARQARPHSYEAALSQAEATLLEDGAAFDRFLKESDEKVQQAMRRADTETKAKQEKVTELKKLNNALAVAQSELRKVQEQTEECKRYATFLDSVTPPEWFAAQNARYEAEWQAKVDAWNAECQAIADAISTATEAKQAAEERYATARTQQQAEALTRALQQPQPVPPVKPTEEELWERRMAEPMFFQDSRQLRHIFSHLEEHNLFLIQTAQEAEEAAEAATAELNATIAQMDAEAAALTQQIESLTGALAKKTEHCQTLKEAAAQMGGNSGVAPGMAQVMQSDQLVAKIRKVWARCGGESDAGKYSQMSATAMLAGIEARLEEVIAAAALLPPETVQAAERAQEQERRRVAREEKAKKEKAENEVRIKKALERAAAPAFKKHGKPVMQRSAPPQRVHVTAHAAHAGIDQELELYLQRVDLL
ncbi:Cilia- and flagella-associated protein 100 [Coccomyxa sp. Obi]|nr:Cilia- and flagella-associated protein 100 [Coccomyxa sp. Obi]